VSTTSDSSPVLVVGGGIAGLSTALALSRKGIPVQVIEQAAEFKMARC
jgi:3-hydroxybenzoate 6-monooxygenase